MCLMSPSLIMLNNAMPPEHRVPATYPSILNAFLQPLFRHRNLAAPLLLLLAARAPVWATPKRRWRLNHGVALSLPSPSPRSLASPLSPLCRRCRLTPPLAGNGDKLRGITNPPGDDSASLTPTLLPAPSPQSRKPPLPPLTNSRRAPLTSPMNRATPSSCASTGGIASSAWRHTPTARSTAAAL